MNHASKAGPSARPFCAFHPAGVRCQYCASRPRATKVKTRNHSAQAALEVAKKAQRAYWDAMADLECFTGLELDWQDCDLAEYTLTQLHSEFPAKS